MQLDFFQKEISFLKGVGPQRAEALGKELSIKSFGDLLFYFPFRYVDRTQFYQIKNIHADLPYIQVKGVIKNFYTRGDKRKPILIANFEDETGSMELVWFQGAKWILTSLKTDIPYIVFGKPGVFNGQLNIAHPEIEAASEAQESNYTTLQPVYNTTEKLKVRGIDSKMIARMQRSLQQQLPAIEENISSSVTHDLKLMSRNDALRQIHFPESAHQINAAQYRLKFEELFFLQLKLQMQRNANHHKLIGNVFGEVGSLFNNFYHHHLPFKLTNAQKRVIREIRNDMGTGAQMNRLLQGDVGSGKTAVALMTMLIAADNGFQSCLMAPTEILARQHALTIQELVKKLDIHVDLLTGSVKQSERKHIHERLLSGKTNILIGTHALIEDQVQFKNLGYVVIDEQHRFGVEQRSKLWKKNPKPPHILVMTATPIPRTLAMTVFGDLDNSVIDELPPGRQPIQTVHKTDANRLSVFEFMRKQISEGRQIYIVYPLIEESEKMDLKNLEDGYESICRAFPQPQFQVSIVHGRMKADAKNFEMQRFIKNQTHIMVATTVIEVGVNVPNASVMIIENAERFGLAQLHQLRGRVGRGADQSYCVLMTKSNLSPDSKKRIEIMCSTNDGFKIAEADLALRGPGDSEGTRQSGMPDFKIANLASDGKIVEQTKLMAEKILAADPQLEKEENKNMGAYFHQFQKLKTVWSLIS